MCRFLITHTIDACSAWVMELRVVHLHCRPLSVSRNGKAPGSLCYAALTSHLCHTRFPRTLCLLGPRFPPRANIMSFESTLILPPSPRLLCIYRHTPPAHSTRRRIFGDAEASTAFCNNQPLVFALGTRTQCADKFQLFWTSPLPIRGIEAPA